MSNRLEKYLQTVGLELRELPTEQRESELREMRQHLEAIVARLQEGGLSETEAVEAATAQFGAARKVGRELKCADEAREPWWQILLAPVAAVACAIALGIVEDPLVQAVANQVTPWTPPLARALECVMSWPAFLLAGAVAGLISPRWGGRLSLGLLVPYLCLLLTTWQPGAYAVAAGYMLSSSSAIFFGSRWASRRSQRRTDAQRA